MVRNVTGHISIMEIQVIIFFWSFPDIIKIGVEMKECSLRDGSSMIWSLCACVGGGG